MSVTGLQTEGLKYAKAIFDTVRRMSADTLGVSRQGYSELETDVLHYLQGLGRDIGLEVRADDAGNVWMTMPGRDRTLPAFVAGSHVDSVPQGGNYDGLAGVTAALTVAWWMHRHQVQLERDYTVLMMRCEESSYFGKAYVGSLGMMGRLTQSDLMLRHRTEDITLGQCISACGLDPSKLTAGTPIVDLKISPASSNCISSRVRRSRATTRSASASSRASAATSATRTWCATAKRPTRAP